MFKNRGCSTICATICYLTRNCERSQAYRAVGSAVGKNPYAPKVPCHRVVNSNGKIGNYSADGGVTKKIELLEEEGVFVENGGIEDFEEKLFIFKS